MLSEEKIRMYRKMTVAQKFREFEQLSRTVHWAWKGLPREELARIAERLRRSHDLGNERIVRRFRLSAGRGGRTRKGKE